MPKHRTYKLLCPIARALDKLGDRWTLLILRDLHAGPARFNDIAQGLRGLASNLLAARLETLQADGLVTHRPTDHRAMVYELTDAGERTGPVLFELAAFGAHWPPPATMNKPGNLRTVVVTVKEALRRVVTATDALDIELVVDQEHFGVVVDQGVSDVSYGPRPEAPTAVRTDYESFIAAGDGRMSATEFATSHVELIRGDPTSVGALFVLLRRAFAE
ncbi:MAG: helix-turn-helix transcriptional regulator [bacterium]|nr:helix-turn-helix transcriptional regulator [bacterium]MCP4893913.1 helix-turn-helix transcriptional regulator [Actinomycetales bacterium]